MAPLDDLAGLVLVEVAEAVGGGAVGGTDGTG